VEEGLEMEKTIGRGSCRKEAAVKIWEELKTI
jgi:hypothetical protein